MGVVSQLNGGQAPAQGVVGRIKQQQQQAWEADNRAGQAAQRAAGVPSLASAISSPLGVTPQQRQSAVNPAPAQPAATGPTKLPGRDLPVVGPVLRALDVVEANPIRRKAGEIVQELYTPGAGLGAINALTGAAERTIGAKAASLVTSPLAKRVVQTGVAETVAGVPLAAGQYLASKGASGQADLGEVAKQGAIGGVAGGVLGAAAPVLGAGVRRFAPGISDALAGLVKRRQAISPEMEQTVQSAMAAAEPTANAATGLTGNLRPASQESYINRVMSTIRDEVNQRLTPPLENPNELAKWLRPHLGDNSLNEVRKLSYDDMAELAQEVRSNLSTYDTALQVAKERGYKLDDILSGKLPSITERAATDAQKRAYGIYDAPRVNVAQRPIATSPMAPAATEQPGLLNRIGSGIVGTIKQAGDQFTGGPNAGISPFRQADPYAALKTDTKSQLRSRFKKEPRAPLGVTASKAYTAVVDDLHPIQEFTRAVEDITGQAAGAADDPYKLALGSRGADMVARQILTQAQVDSAGNVIGKSLKDTLSQLPPGAFVDFEDYLVNKHAITRMEDRGEKVFRDSLGWTPDAGRTKVAELEAKYPAFKQTAQEVYDFQTNMLQRWMVDTGLLSGQQAAAMLEQNPYYVPMKRYFSDLEKTGGTGTRAKRAYGNQLAPIKKYSDTGSQRQVLSPIESMIENTDAFVKAAKRNQSMQALVRQLEQAPDDLAGFAQIVTDPPKKAGAVDITAADGVEDLLNSLDDDFDKVFRKKGTDDVVRVMVNGEPVYLQVNDKPLLEAILQLGPQQSNWFMNLVGKVTNTMKTLTTGVNPVFSLTRNLLRDIPSAYIASKTSNNPISFAGDMFSAALDIMKNREAYRDFKALGGGHSSPIAADRNLLKQSKRQVLPRKQGFASIGDAAGRGLEWLENMMNAVESAPRLAEYKRLASDGNVDDRLAGLFEAGDITVNFKRRGRISREVDKVFPYFNAAVQSLDKFARMYKDDPAQALVKTFAAITVPTMALYALNYDDPNYQKLSNRVKDNFLLIPKGDGTFFKIAKPREIGTLFSDIPERLLRLFAEQDPEAFKDFAGQLRTAFSLPGLEGATSAKTLTDIPVGFARDTVGGPLMDLLANKDFADRPIVPGYLENLSPGLQYDANTSSVAKWLGQQLEGTFLPASPKQLDYLLKSYGGVIGQLGIPATAPSNSGQNALESVGRSFLSNVTADPVYSNDISSELYRNKDKLDTAKADFAVTGELPDYYNDALRKFLNKVTDAQSDIRKQQRAIQGDTSIPADQRREQLRVLQEQINQLGQKANQVSSPIMSR
jgi:hypothetical protein